MAAPALVGVVVGLLTSAAIPAGTLSAAGVTARDAMILAAIDREAATIYGELPAICAASKRFRTKFSAVCAVANRPNTPAGRIIAVVSLFELSRSSASTTSADAPPHHCR